MKKFVFTCQRLKEYMVHGSVFPLNGNTKEMQNMYIARSKKGNYYFAEIKTSLIEIKFIADIDFEQLDIHVQYTMKGIKKYLFDKESGNLNNSKAPLSWSTVKNIRYDTKMEIDIESLEISKVPSNSNYEKWKLQ